MEKEIWNFVISKKFIKKIEFPLNLTRKFSWNLKFRYFPKIYKENWISIKSDKKIFMKFEISLFLKNL
jgi:hypothetical protein